MVIGIKFPLCSLSLTSDDAKVDGKWNIVLSFFSWKELQKYFFISFHQIALYCQLITFLIAHNVVSNRGQISHLIYLNALYFYTFLIKQILLIWVFSSTCACACACWSNWWIFWESCTCFYFWISFYFSIWCCCTYFIYNIWWGRLFFLKCSFINSIR